MSIPITTAQAIDGRPAIKYVGVFSGYGRLKSSIGKQEAYFDQGLSEALSALEEKATAAGANAVVGVLVEHTHFLGGEWIVVTGTAVTI